MAYGKKNWSDVERKIEQLYEEVGQYYQEAHGDEYPHYSHSLDLDKKIFYIECGKKKADKEMAGMVSDTLGDFFADNQIDFTIKLK